MKNPPKSSAFADLPNRHVLPAAALLALFLSGCLTAFGLEKAPETVAGTRIEIRETERGLDYIARLGGTETTELFAVLDGGGSYRIEFVYEDSLWSRIDTIFVETSAYTEPLKVADPRRGIVDGDRKSETGSAVVRRSVLEAAAETRVPTIYLKGRSGTIIIEMGPNGKTRLEELLAYGKERFPEM